MSTRKGIWLRRLIALLCAALIILAVDGVSCAQNAATLTPTFEVASIRPDTSGRPEWKASGVPPHGGLFRMVNVPLKELVKRAFGVEDYALTAPRWLEDLRFDLTARVPSGRSWTGQEIDEMLRALLVERFHLKVRYRQKMVKGYQLTAGSNLKLKPSDPKLVGGRSSGPSLIAGHGMSLAELAKALSGVLGQPVSDSTRLSGGFEIRLAWYPDDPHAVAAEAQAGLDVSSLPSLFGAIQEELGLRLRPARVPVDAIVVDEISKRPEEN